MYGSTLELVVALRDGLHERLIAELDEIGFTGFVQETDLLKAYIPFELWTADLKERVVALLSQLDPSAGFSENELAPQDWNRSWEASIQPVSIPPFYVRPSWAGPADGFIDVIVDPKMSFGTGHHETTRLLLRMMPRYVTTGCRVLDAGAGSAILAIAAVKLDAASVYAFDIDPWVTPNVRENLKLNSVSTSVTFREGGIDVIPERNFDVILANINRNVLLSYMEDFHFRLAARGFLLLSGVLIEDKPVIERAGLEAGFHLVDEACEGAWWAGAFARVDA